MILLRCQNLLITTSESNSTLNIKNLLDNYASLYLGTESVLAQIYVGRGTHPGLTFLTHTNHKIIFKTNSWYSETNPSMIIETNGNVIIYKNLICNGILKTPQVETNTTKLKLKGGTSGTQILDSSDSPIIDILPFSVSISKNLDISNSEVNSNLTITNNTSVGIDSYASLFLKANGIQGQFQVGFNRLMIGTSSMHKITFATNMNGTNTIPMAIESNGDVNVFTRFTNTSDSKLKDNQQKANLDDLQTIFDNISVKTYERNDLGHQKRIGFIAQDVERSKLLISNHENFTNIVGSSTFQREENGIEEDVKTLDYARLVCILWGALKTSNKKIDALEMRIKAIEEK